MTTTTTSATTATGEETRTTTFRSEQIEYYPDSLKVVTNIITNSGPHTTITAEIDADISHVDEHGDYTDYGAIWFWSIEVDELGRQHLDYYEAIARQLANLRINELQNANDRH